MKDSCLPSMLYVVSIALVSSIEISRQTTSVSVLTSLGR